MSINYYHSLPALDVWDTLIYIAIDIFSPEPSELTFNLLIFSRDVWDNIISNINITYPRISCS